MFGFTLLDLILVLMLISYFVAGLRNGFFVTLGGIFGFVGGAVAAFLAIPMVSEWVPDAQWRLLAIVITAVVLVLTGQVLGAGLGAAIRRSLDAPSVGTVDRLLGGAVNVTVSALVISMLAFSVSSLGVPFVSRQIADSQVIGAIEDTTPAPVRTWLAQLRAIAVQDGIPKILEAADPNVPSVVPDANVNTPELAAAAGSVLRIAGTAFQCGQNQTGSGFVVAEDRVITNAHVVAGVPDPVVEVPGNGALQGSVVYFDAARDIAVLRVDGLNRRPLPLGAELPAGTTAAFAGYPAGGPYQIQPASVQSLSNVRVQNIYGENPAVRQLYTLAANVQQGNSGGPLLDLKGRVAGVVFAKASGNAPVGYALSLKELKPIADGAKGMTERVGEGRCTRR